MIKKLSFINLKGIVTLVVILALIDVGVAYIASPFATRAVQESINRLTPAKIYIGSARFHPFLLSVGVSDFEVMDPDNTSQRVFKAGHVGLWMDPVSLLRKRMDVSRANFQNIELSVVRDASGKVNLEKFKFGKQEAKGVWDTLKQANEVRSSDWFQKSYRAIKNILKQKKETKEAKKIYKANIQALEKGRLVEFETDEDSIFEIHHVDLQGGVVALEDAGRALATVRDIDADIKGFKVLRSGGISFTSLAVKGNIPAQKTCSFDVNLDQQAQSFTSNVNIRNLDLAALAPLYENSLPVSFNRGYLTLESKSRVALDKLESTNHIRLEEHELVARKQFGLFGGAPEAVVTAINKRSPLDLNFQIGGTADNPSFDGFQKELMKIAGDELKQGLLSGLKDDPGKKIGEWSEKLKKIF